VGDVRWGAHEEFTDLYEPFLDRAYAVDADADTPRVGRCLVTDSVDQAIRDRDCTTVFDCAAGTGFPALNLAAKRDQDLTVHLSDGDPAMVAILDKRASNLGLLLDDIAPERYDGRPRPEGADRLVLSWAELGQVDGHYDYVMCRGNSLAYADTWTGRSIVATDVVLQSYLDRMAEAVKPGGYLHVDAPWKLGLAKTSYHREATEVGSIWEQVTVERDRREWWLSITPDDGAPAVQFKRYSSLLTIEYLADVLHWMGFGSVEPFQMDGERKVFGTIIARKPESGLTPTRLRRRKPRTMIDRRSDAPDPSGPPRHRA
jgi:hypothetical protein